MGHRPSSLRTWKAGRKGPLVSLWEEELGGLLPRVDNYVEELVERHLVGEVGSEQVWLQQQSKLASAYCNMECQRSC